MRRRSVMNEQANEGGNENRNVSTKMRVKIEIIPKTQIKQNVQP